MFCQFFVVKIYEQEKKMTGRQLRQFEQLLLKWKETIEKELELEIELDNVDKGEGEADETDFIDKKNIIDFQQKRQQHHESLLKEISHAMTKIKNKTFGFCEETEEPITLERLKANPIARYSLEAQLRLENSK